MNNFSNLPPGVTTSMIPGCGPEEPCDVCGGYPDSETDPCICPECPVCEDVGELRCYANRGDRARDMVGHHNLIINAKQAFLRAWQDAIIEDYDRMNVPEEDFNEPTDPNEGLPPWA